MFNRIYEFVASNTSSLIRKISIKDNILTLYSHYANKFDHLYDETNFITNELAKDHPGCEKPYQAIQQTDPKHDVIYPHVNDVIEIEQVHTHVET